MKLRQIINVAICLFLADVLVGFIKGGAGNGSLEAAKQQLAVSSLLSFCFYSAIFAVVAIRRGDRPFLHASLALLVNFAFQFALGAIFPWLNSTPFLLVALGWFIAVIALLAGTSVGRLICMARLRIVAKRSTHRVRADA